MLDCWKADPQKRPSSIDIYGLLTRSDNIIQPVLACPALAQINNCEESTEVDMSPAPLKSSGIFKKPMLRQSSSIISVDSKFILFSIIALIIGILNLRPNKVDICRMLEQQI